MITTKVCFCVDPITGAILVDTVSTSHAYDDQLQCDGDGDNGGDGSGGGGDVANNNDDSSGSGESRSSGTQQDGDDDDGRELGSGDDDDLGHQDDHDTSLATTLATIATSTSITTPGSTTSTIYTTISTTPTLATTLVDNVVSTTTFAASSVAATGFDHQRTASTRFVSSSPATTPHTMHTSGDTTIDALPSASTIEAASTTSNVQATTGLEVVPTLMPTPVTPGTPGMPTAGIPGAPATATATPGNGGSDNTGTTVPTVMATSTSILLSPSVRPRPPPPPPPTTTSASYLVDLETPLMDPSTNAKSAAKIAGGVAAGVVGLIGIFYLASWWRSTEDTEVANTTTTSSASFDNRRTSAFAQSHETTRSMQGVSEAIRIHRERRARSASVTSSTAGGSGSGNGGVGGGVGSVRSGESAAERVAKEVPGMGSRNNSWVDGTAIAKGTGESNILPQKSSRNLVLVNPPKELKEYRYNGPTVPPSTQYTAGGGFTETQLSADIPGVVGEEKSAESGTVAVQLLRTKLEQGAIDRQEFEHIRAVMLRSIAMTDDDFATISVTDV